MSNLNHDTYQLIPLLRQAGYNACSYFTYYKKLYSMQNRS